VAASEWLEPAFRAELSQGDIFDGLPFCTPIVPVTHLTKGQAKGNPVVWIPSKATQPLPQGQQNHALFAYRLGYGIIVSHDCAIDKPQKSTRILFAPVGPLANFDAVTQDAVRRQAHLGAMLLPDIPGIGDAYADLRVITPFPHEIVSSLAQVASLTDRARDRLQSALVAFFVFRERPAL
jgi:hypothetical protein